MKAKLFLFSLCFGVCALGVANAQTFGDEADDSNATVSFEPEKRDTVPISPDKIKTPEDWTNLREKGLDALKEKDKKAAKAGEDAAQKGAQSKPAQPVVKKPLTSDVRQYKIVDGKEVEEEATEAIYVFFKDFKMVRNVGRTACDIRIVLVTRLAETLSSIGMKIVWPGQTTTITYDGVEPGVETYADYRFYGDGCYSLDKLPNITVNRCRLKGRTQKECAALVQLMRWVDD